MTDKNIFPNELGIKTCTELGIIFPSSRMSNGEYRFRCIDETNGYGYILTKMPKDICGWQNSHYHKYCTETYIVQNGWIAIMELIDQKPSLKVLYPNQIATIPVKRHHNIYMSAGSVIHTVKHGNCSTKRDWTESLELDKFSKILSEEDILTYK